MPDRTFLLQVTTVVATFAISLTASADVFNMPSGQTSLQMVTVSNPGNPNDPVTGFGGVDVLGPDHS